MAEYLAELLMNTAPPVGLDTIATRLPVVQFGLPGVQKHQLKNLGCRTIVSGHLPQVVDRFREHAGIANWSDQTTGVGVGR